MCGAHGEHETAKVRDVKEIGGERGLRGRGPRKEWMSCLLNDLKVFGINADQWTTAAQDGEGWCKTVDQGTERFEAKWIAAEKARAGLRHAIVRPNVTGTTKETIAQSRVLVLVRSP